MDARIRKIHIIILAVALLFCPYLEENIVSQDFIQIDSIKFYTSVKIGLNKYLNLIPENREYLFGFNNREEFKEIELGLPLQIIIFNESAFCAEDPEELYHSLERWNVPIMINDEYRCFLEMIYSEGEYIAVGIGLNELAFDLDSFERQTNFRSCLQRGLFIDYGTSGYCLVTIDNNTREFIPFRPLDCNIDLNFDNPDRYSPVELFETSKRKRENQLQ